MPLWPFPYSIQHICISSSHLYLTNCTYVVCKRCQVQYKRPGGCCVDTFLCEGYLLSSSELPSSVTHAPQCCDEHCRQDRMLWNNTQSIYMDSVRLTCELSWPTHSHFTTKTRNVTRRHGGQLYMLSHCSVMRGILHRPALNFMANFHHGLHLFGECKVKRRGAVLLD